MCLSSEAFALFLNLLSPEIVTSAPGTVTVHATARDVVWRQTEADQWCAAGVAEHMR